jgi:hypothetical protein
VKRGTRRLIVKLALCTLAGAVVTWGVAWGCALWAFPRASYDRLLETAWPIPVGAPRPPAEAGEYGNAFRSVRRWSVDWFEEHTNDYRVHFEEFGFPIRAMRITDTTSITDGVVNSEFLLNGHCIAAPRWLASNRVLPTRVIPLGFTLNTLLAAGVLLGVVEGFAFARRRVRRAKGRCVACGYDRGGLAKDAACPECGGKA